MATVGSMVVNLIARTERFQRDMNNAVKKLKGFQREANSSLKSIQQSAEFTSKLLRNAFLFQAVGGVAEGVGEMAKALREGDDALYAFVSHLPFIGRTVTQFRDMYMEVSGVAHELRQIEKATGILADLDIIRGKQISYLSDIGKSDEMLERAKATEEYEKAISQLDSAARRLKDMGIDVLPNGIPTPSAASRLKDMGIDVLLNIGADKARQLRVYEEELSRIEKKYRDIEAAAKSAKINSALEPYYGLLNSLRDAANGIDDIERTLLSASNMAGWSDVRYKQNLAELRSLQDTANLREQGQILARAMMTPTEIFREEMNRIEKLARGGFIGEEIRGRAEKAAREAFAPSVSIPRPTPGDASSRQIRSNLVSVAGLSTGGVIDKQDTTNQLLQEVNRNLRELKNDIRMN